MPAAAAPAGAARLVAFGDAARGVHLAGVQGLRALRTGASQLESLASMKPTPLAHCRLSQVITSELSKLQGREGEGRRGTGEGEGAGARARYEEREWHRPRRSSC